MTAFALGLAQRAAPLCERLRRGERAIARHRTALAIGTLLLVVGVAHGYDMLHWPYIEDDEGTYLARAWAVFHLGRLAPGIYIYDHPPLGWIQIAVWQLITGGSHVWSAIASGRTLMLLFQLASALLVVYIGRRASGRLWVGILAAALVSLLPFGLQYQRRVLLDNICAFWLLASIAALCGRVTLRRVLLSGLALGIAVLSKEIALAAFPALAVMVARRARPEHRLFAVVGWIAVTVSACSVYLLTALLKGELFPAGTALGGTRPHVSLICTVEWQASRGADGGVIDSSSGFWHAVSSWASSEPLLVIGGTVAMVYLIVVRRRDVIPSMIGWTVVALWLFLGRGGLVQDFYLVPLLPLLALAVAIALAALADSVRTWAVSPRQAAAVVVAAGLVGIAWGATLDYQHAGAAAWTSDPVAGQQEAVSWIEHNLPYSSRILIDDYMWPELHEPSSGAPFPNAVYYWDAGYDPDVQRTVFNGTWRDVDYVIATPQVYHDVRDLGFPLVAEALEHSVLVRTFSTGNWPVQIRRVEPRSPVVLLLRALRGSAAPAHEPSCMSYASETAATAPAQALPAVGLAVFAKLESWSASAVARELGDYRDIHATWIRHDFAWNVIEPTPDRFDWGGYDRLVGAARSRGINVIATITYTPAWANGGHSDSRYAPTSASQFGTFAGEVAARYGPRGVHTYEIWNEPNIQYWQPKPNPVDYAQDLCAAYQAIHRADPQAIVLAGGTSPAADTATTYAPQTWLSDLYADGAGHCFDDVAYHPYVDSIAAHDNLGGNWYLMASAVVPHNLRSIMVSHGDGAKRIWATEVGCNRDRLGDQECADRLSEALALWRTYSWAGALCWFTYDGSDAYSLVDQNGNRRPEWYAYQRAAAAD